MANGILGFVLGLFIGTIGGFILCALAVIASRDDHRREQDAIRYQKRQKETKKEEPTDDREPVSEVGFEDF